MERDQEDNVRHELDNQFASLRELIFAPDPSSSGSNMIPLGVRESGPYPKPPEDAEAVVSKLLPSEGDDYDQHVRELAFDKRAKPKDRTKTEEELALEAKEALEKAERRRRRRMLGLDESEDEDESGKGKKRKLGGDDLDDDFDEGPEDDFNALGAGLEGDMAAKALDSEEDDEDEEDDEGSEGSEEESDGEEFDEGDGSDEPDESDASEGEEGEHEQLVASRMTSTKAKSNGKRKAKQELPFTFPCPATHEEFLDIIEDVDDDDVPTVVQRIRALYHTSLGADNKFKLQVYKPLVFTI